MDLTRQLRGKQVAHVMTNGNVLVLQMHDGSEILVKWVDDNGETIKGKPVIGSRGVRLRAEGMQDLIHLPAGAH